ncbi:hypothetical protein BMS3Abin03_02223 [bacterium BMS3Abin03]|nr:hypothetical protein BMS3Abin03_02223 [bacterium BMS3Abin03]
MKSIIPIILVLLLIQFVNAQELQSEKTGNLTVVITGLENDNGMVLLGLYNSRENYEGRGKAYRGEKDSIENKQAVFIFDELPFGEYAIKVYHDENSNGKLDKNFLGIPTEDYGFSNNASGTFGPADYDDAKFLFNKNKMTIGITIN